MSTDSRQAVSVLVHPAALATKRWFVGPEGRPKVDEYGKGKNFEAHTFPIACIQDLAELLTHLATEPSAFVIRGELIPGRDPSHVQRTKNVKDGQPASFREVPRPWMMVDVDKLPPEQCTGVDLSTPEGCEAAARLLLSKLPSELTGVSCFWSLSASAGMKPGLSGHFWFWLDKAAGEADLTRWADNVNDAAGRKLIDPAVYRTVQPHYTANPLFDTGLVDPVACRTGFFEGVKDAVALPQHTERRDGYLRHLAPLKDPRNTNVHDPIRNACASYFCSRGPDAPSLALESAIQNAIATAKELRGESDAVWQADDVASYVASGRAFAKDRAAQGQNLAINPSDGTPKATIANIRAVLTASPEWYGVIAFNERKERVVMLRPPPFKDGYAGDRAKASYPSYYTDTDDKRIVCWLAEEHQIQAYSSTVAEVIDVIAKENSFDPVREHLIALEWDHVPRIDTWLIKYQGVEDTRYTRRVGAMWLIQGAARTLDPGCMAHCVLALEGEQGLGKSTTFEILTPGGKEYFREGLGDIHSNDTMMSMQSAFIIELRELAGLSSKEIEAIKGFLDRSNDHFRSPYDRRPADHYRRCILGATTNKACFLNDETGARRWWPVTCTRIDRDGLREVRDQLWAEAVHRYRMGEQWWVDANDPDFVKEQSARFEDDERTSVLATALEKGAKNRTLGSTVTPEINSDPHQISITQVLEHVFNTALKDQKRAEQMVIAKMLTRLGWIKKHTEHGKVWVKAA